MHKGVWPLTLLTCAQRGVTSVTLLTCKGVWPLTLLTGAQRGVASVTLLTCAQRGVASVTLLTCAQRGVASVTCAQPFNLIEQIFYYGRHLHVFRPLKNALQPAHAVHFMVFVQIIVFTLIYFNNKVDLLTLIAKVC